MGHDSLMLMFQWVVQKSSSYCERSALRKAASSYIVAQTDVGSPQAEISEDAIRCRPADAAVTSQQGASESSAHSARRRPMSTRGTGSKTAVGKGSRAQTAGQKVVRLDCD